MLQAGGVAYDSASGGQHLFSVAPDGALGSRWLFVGTLPIPSSKSPPCNSLSLTQGKTLFN